MAWPAGEEAGPEYFGFADDPNFQPLGTYPSITRKPGCKSLDEPLPDPHCGRLPAGRRLDG